MRNLDSERALPRPALLAQLPPPRRPAAACTQLLHLCLLAHLCRHKHQDAAAQGRGVAAADAVAGGRRVAPQAGGMPCLSAAAALPPQGPLRAHDRPPLPPAHCMELACTCVHHPPTSRPLPAHSAHHHPLRPAARADARPPPPPGPSPAALPQAWRMPWSAATCARCSLASRGTPRARTCWRRWVLPAGCCLLGAGGGGCWLCGCWLCGCWLYVCCPRWCWRRRPRPLGAAVAEPSRSGKGCPPAFPCRLSAYPNSPRQLLAPPSSLLPACQYVFSFSYDDQGNVHMAAGGSSKHRFSTKDGKVGGWRPGWARRACPAAAVVARSMAPCGLPVPAPSDAALSCFLPPARVPRWSLSSTRCAAQCA